MARLLEESACRRHGWWLLLIVAALLYLPGTGTLPLMDRDEPRFAHATVEMMQRGTWTIPWFNGAYRFDKPPLTYWWMRLHYSLLGVNELAARLHSVAATYLAALALFAMGARLAGARAGLAAGLAWLTTLQVLVHGRLCVADMPMVLCVILASWALMELLRLTRDGDVPAPGKKWFWVLWVSLGLGFLAKGPVAWLVPGLALVLWRFVFWRKKADWSPLRPVAGIAVCLALVALWGVPALIETRGAFWSVGMGEHIVKRGTDVFNGRAFIPGYYLLTAFVSLFPWIAFLPAVWRHLRRGMSATSAFLLAWFVAPHALFFFYATQLPHYVMPGFPAFLLLAALSADSMRPRDALEWDFPKTFLLGFCLVGGFVVCVGTRAIVPHSGVGALLSCAGSLLLMLGLFGVCARCKRAFAVPVMIVCLIAMAATITHASRTIRSLHPVIALARDESVRADGTRRIACQFTEPSLVFHAGAPWKFTDKLPSAEAAFSKSGPAVLVMLRREWTLDGWLRRKIGRGDKAPGEPDRDLSSETTSLLARYPEATITEISGINLARSSWVELVVMKKER